jgi:hypothetical protein
LPLPHVPAGAWRAGRRLGHVPSAGFEVTAGDAAAYRSSAEAFRHFCATCGTPLTWRAIDNPRLVDISIATLDEPVAVAPGLHLWTQHQLAWLKLADHLPRYPTNRRPRPAP